MNSIILVHERNLEHKIKSNYNGKGEIIERFKNEKYIPMRDSIFDLKFVENNMRDFIKAAEIFTNYYMDIEKFSKENGISSQSKFASTFLEEISAYMFKDLPLIKNGVLDVFNKGIYAGMKIVSSESISIVKKDVDFCIGKEINISIDDAYSEKIILPVVAVEVKTYLDATMFGEIKSSSKAIRSATPNSKTYVLMGYKDLADEHIISARQDAALTEMFVLRKSKNDPMEGEALYEYWKEIKNAIDAIEVGDKVPLLGRLLYSER